MSLNRRMLIWAAILAVLVGGLGTVGGFVVGTRWPLEGLEEWLGLRVDPRMVGWEVFAETDLARYEVMRAQVGSELYLFGGFYMRGTRTSARVEVIDLRSGQWTRLGDMPVPLTHANPAVVGNEMWIAGGFEGDNPGPATDRVWRYLIAEDRWVEGPSLPAPRGGGALVGRGDTLHYIGGYLPDRDTDSPDHWTLVVGETSWRAASPLPRPRGHVSAAVGDDRIYVLGGNLGHDPVPIDVDYLDVYDPATRRWEQGPSSPISTSHTEPATLTYDGWIMSVGGRDRTRGLETQDDIVLFDWELGRWMHGGRVPRRQMGGVAAVLDDTLVVGFGSEFGNNPTNRTIWKRPLRDHWRQADTMPVRLGEVAAGVIDGTMYVVGEGSPLTLAYDLGAGTWSDPTSLSARPAPGDHHAAEVVDGELFLLGGLSRNAPGRVQIFDPVRDSWRLGPRIPFSAGSSASAYIGNQIYVAGGIVNDTTTNQAAVLDLESMEWRSIRPMPRPRNHAASGTDGTRFFVFGGRGPGSGGSNVVANGYDDVQIYDPATDQWSVSDGSRSSPMPLPQARGGMGKAAYLNGEFWVIGGETRDSPGATSDNTYSRVDIYDPVTNQWRRGPDMPTARHGIFPLTVAGRIMVAAGGTRSAFSQSPVLEIIWPR